MELSQIKVMSKEQRMELAKYIRTDPELQNVISGIGGLCESASHGRLIGTITENGKPLSRVEIAYSVGGKTDVKVHTNQFGYYQIDLSEGNYTVTILYGETPVSQEVEILNGKTSVFDQDFGEGKEDEGSDSSDKTDTGDSTGDDTGDGTGDDTGV
ncbi:MAG: hypothetical protein C0596_16125 [Marinilabiliales bacterium]|nr:MAG: hypothetical protein C0596_16125 [Marinilabiliales bacterium]